MKLKMKTKVINTVDSDDFNEFVEFIYGGSFEFVAIHEADNDSSYEYTVSMKDLTGYRNLEEESKIRKGKYPTYCIGSLLNCLLEDGYIKEGDYLIDVCW